MGLFRLALLLEAQGKRLESTKLLTSAVKLSPEDPKLRAALGRLYERNNAHERAVLELERVFKLDPKITEARLNLALVQLQAKQYSEANSHLRELVKALPKSGTSLECLWLVAIRTG